MPDSSSISLSASPSPARGAPVFYHLGGAVMRPENSPHNDDEARAQKLSRRDRLLRESVSMTQINDDRAGRRGNTVASMDALIERRKSELKEDEVFDAAALMPAIGRSANVPLDRLLADDDRKNAPADKVRHMDTDR